MILSRKNTITSGANRTCVKAAITTDHPASICGEPVIVLEDGGAVDIMSWIALAYRIEEASTEERAMLEDLGLGDW